MDTQRRFVVVGAGGVGGWLLNGLAHFLEYQAPGSALIIVDGDHFEEKNLERQDFAEFGMKADVRAYELQPKFPNTAIIPIARWVVSDEEADSGTDEEDNPRIGVGQLIEEGDVVFAVVDNFACRKIIFEQAMKLETVDVFTGGNDEALYGSTYHYYKRDGKEYIDSPTISKPEYMDPPDRNPGSMSCEERSRIEGGTQLLASNMLVAGFMLARAHHCLFQDNHDLQAEIFFDLAFGISNGVDRRTDEVLAESEEKVPVAAP